MAAFTVCLEAKATSPAAAIVPVDFHDNHVMHGQLGEGPACLESEAGQTCKLMPTICSAQSTWCICPH